MTLSFSFSLFQNDVILGQTDDILSQTDVILGQMDVILVANATGTSTIPTSKYLLGTAYFASSICFTSRWQTPLVQVLFLQVNDFHGQNTISVRGRVAISVLLRCHLASAFAQSAFSKFYLLRYIVQN